MYDLLLCDGDHMPRYSNLAAPNLGQAVEIARELLSGDDHLLKIEIHLGGEVVYQQGRGWSSRRLTKHTPPAP